jgi:hypothetical protein
LTVFEAWIHNSPFGESDSRLDSQER